MVVVNPCIALIKSGIYIYFPKQNEFVCIVGAVELSPEPCS